MSKSRVFEEMQEIRRLRVLGVPGYEIMRQMNLSRHCYQDRVSRINKIDEEYIKNEFHNQVASELVMLQDRLLSDIRIAHEISSDKTIHPAHRLDALNLNMHCSIAMVKLVTEGPTCLTRAKKLRDSIMSGEKKLNSLMVGELPSYNDNNNDVLI